MKHKTSELEGALLDAAVAKAEGCALTQYDDTGGPISFQPSVLWEHGGPIIERESMWIEPVFFEDFVEVAPFTVDYWEATDSRTGRRGQGATPLIAAMRAYVASKLGEEVEL